MSNNRLPKTGDLLNEATIKMVDVTRKRVYDGTEWYAFNDIDDNGDGSWSCGNKTPQTIDKVLGSCNTSS